MTTFKNIIPEFRQKPWICFSVADALSRRWPLNLASLPTRYAPGGIPLLATYAAQTAAAQLQGRSEVPVANAAGEPPYAFLQIARDLSFLEAGGEIAWAGDLFMRGRSEAETNTHGLRA